MKQILCEINKYKITSFFFNTFYTDRKYVRVPGRNTIIHTTNLFDKYNNFCSIQYIFF